MKFKFSISVLAATLAFSGTVVLQTEVLAQSSIRSPKNPSQVKPSSVPNQNQATVFECIPQGKAFATVAKRLNPKSNKMQTSSPMIIWESYVFGPEYTPQQRCQLVSQRLTSVVAQNGGSLRNLLLTTGKVNNYTVICYVNKTVEARCNNSNALFTLKPENAKDPGAALGNILRFGIGSAGVKPLRESAGEESVGEEEDVAVEMEAVVEQAFATSYESAGSDSGNLLPSTPEDQPSNIPATETESNQDGW